MPAKRIYDWSSVDWSMSNRRIAEALGCKESSVVSMRYRLGVGRGQSEPRSDSERLIQHMRSPEMRDKARDNQPVATEAAKRSPLSGRGESNVHALDWHLQAPDGTTYRVRNLYEFVRSNPHLFADADVVWKRRGGKRGSGGEYCNATAGLLNIKGGKARTWKGWTLLPLAPPKAVRAWKAWQEWEDDLLRRTYSEVNNKWLAKKLDRPPASIKARASMLGVATKNKFWAEDEDDLIIQTYASDGAKIIAAKLGRSVDSVRKRASMLGVTISAYYWSDAEVRYLKDNHLKMPIRNIAAALHRPIGSIFNKAYNLGITKKKVTS